MATYLVCLNGKNVWVDDGDIPKKRCFRSTWLVEAENKIRADVSLKKSLASHALHSDGSLRG